LPEISPIKSNAFNEQHKRFVTSVNGYIFIVAAALLFVMTPLFLQGSISTGRFSIIVFNPLIMLATYLMSKSTNEKTLILSHKIFCFYLVMNWNITFIMNGGFSSPTAIWLVVAPLFVAIILNAHLAKLTLGLSFISMLIVFTSEALHISLQIEDAINQRTLGIFHIPASLLLAYATINRYAFANETARQAQQTLLNSQQQFLSNIAHELRTPINGIYGVLQILRKKAEITEQQELIDVAAESTQSLTNIINDILQIHHIDKGILSLEQRWSNSQEIFDHLRSLFVPSAQLKKIIFSVRTDDSMPEELYCDKLRLSQVINNITANAIKFTHQGFVKVLASYQDSKLIITVTDTGIGMDEATLAKLFDPFAKGDQSLTSAYGGMGLGMSISQSLVYKMGGTIKAVSTPDIGTVVTISCPLKGRTQHKTDAEEKATDLKQRLKDMSVLVIEDDEASCLTTSQYLKNHCNQVQTATDGADALSKLADENFDLIICDIIMPVMGGREFLNAMQQLGDSTNIIAITGNALHYTKAQFISLGFKGVIYKPYEEEHFIASIKEILQLNI